MSNPEKRVLDKRVSAVFILRKDGAALLQHRDDKPGLVHPGKWTIPGGHLDQNESPESCAKREVFEECNYQCGELKFITRFENHDGDFEPYELSLYCTRFDPKQESQIICREGQELRFVKREAADSIPVLRFLLPHWDAALVWLDA